MQIERAVLGVETLGPGKRLGIWVNGCKRRCKGCVSPRLQIPCPENECDVIEFLSGFNLQKVDGVTISGGEPFDQLTDLKKAVDYFYDNGIKDILIYTGYTKQELDSRSDERITEIFKKIAVLIDGPYVIELDNGKDNLKGSMNQRVLYLNREVVEKYEQFRKRERSMQEFKFGDYVLAVGIPDKNYIKNFVK